MAIKFKNIRSGEVRVAETEPMIAAMFNSSDMGPNVMQGQDFGWRLAPEVVVQMNRIKSNQQTMMLIGQMYNLMLQDIDDKAILQYISDQTAVEDAPVAQKGDYEDTYRKEIRELEEAEREAFEKMKASTEVEVNDEGKLVSKKK